MELKITTLEGKEAGSVTLSDAIFGLEPRADIIQRCVNLAARQAPARHAQDQGPRRDQAHRQEDVRAEGHRRRPPRRQRASRNSAAAAVPSARVVRSHAIDLPKKVRALALKHALSAKAKDGGIVVIDKATVEGRQDQGAARPVRQARPRQRADHRRRRDRRQLPHRRAQHSEYRRAAGAGHQCLRHHAAQDSGADQGRARCAGGALQMTTSDPRHYDVILVAGDHRKGDHGLRAQQGHVQGAPHATKPQIKEAVEKLFDVKVKSVNTLTREGKLEGVQEQVAASSPTSSARS